MLQALRALIARVEVFTDRTELTGHLTSMLRAGGVESSSAGAERRKPHWQGQWGFEFGKAGCGDRI
ncbi:hypothetical protein [Roseococcus sp. YIM B11640]|uniref:hypothetical protein n=1 Tax=Roseococcus sp. YIM B11640 TaxID=3133973 RepID=UPI003C7AFAC8